MFYIKLIGAMWHSKGSDYFRVFSGDFLEQIKYGHVELPNFKRFLGIFGQFWPMN